MCIFSFLKFSTSSLFSDKNCHMILTIFKVYLMTSSSLYVHGLNRSIELIKQWHYIFQFLPCYIISLLLIAVEIYRLLSKVASNTVFPTP